MSITGILINKTFDPVIDTKNFQSYSLKPLFFWTRSQPIKGLEYCLFPNLIKKFHNNKIKNDNKHHNKYGKKK